MARFNPITGERLDPEGKTPVQPEPKPEPEPEKPAPEAGPQTTNRPKGNR